MEVVTVHFNAEIYEVYGDQGGLIDQAISYDELIKLANEKDYEIFDIVGLEDEEDDDYEVPPRKTNVDLVTDFMNFGSPMNQIFVIDALQKHAKNIVDNEEELLKQMEGGFIDGPSWVRCAKDFLKKSDEFYQNN